MAFEDAEQSVVQSRAPHADFVEPGHLAVHRLEPPARVGLVGREHRRDQGSGHGPSLGQDNIDASVNAATPLVIGNLAYFSTSYDTGSLLLKLKKNGAEPGVVTTASGLKYQDLKVGTGPSVVPTDTLTVNYILVSCSSGKIIDSSWSRNQPLTDDQQAAIKAHAGLALTKLTYIPTVAIIGGYSNQNFINYLLLPKDFSYIGFMASFTLFDGFKREHGVKEVKAQAEMADLGVQLTRAIVAAAVKSSYLQLDRSRQLYQLARRMVSATQVVEASYKSDDLEVESARAKMKAEMFRAELEYRQAYAKLKAQMGPQ